MTERVTVTAPATVANVGAGYDVFGFAVDSPVDTVHARLLERAEDRGKVVVKAVLPESLGLTCDATKNTASLCAKGIMDRMGYQCKFGVELTIEKGMGIGTGMGSSAASAAAAAKAMVYFFKGQGVDVPESVVMEALVDAEEAIDGGVHGDNAFSSYGGGFYVIPSSRDPLLYSRFELPDHMRVILATPPVSVLTADARKLVPKEVPLEHSVITTGYAGLAIAGIVKRDLRLFGRGIVDPIVTPCRKVLIPNYDAVVAAATGAGAFGCSISGSGPTVFAVCDNNMDLKAVARGMAEAFGCDDPVTVRVALPNNEGAKVTSRDYKF